MKVQRGLLFDLKISVKDLRFSKEVSQKQAWDRLCLHNGKKSHYVGDCKVKPLGLVKGR